MTGSDLDRTGKRLDGLPVPISTPGLDNAPYLSAGHYITKDPDSGIQNVGNYRGQLKAPRRLGMNPSVELRAGIYAHWQKYKARGEPMPCCRRGRLPAASSPMPRCRRWRRPRRSMRSPGAIAGCPINVVRAKTVDLLVPAEAEIVIEGLINTELLEPEAPFGESHGYVNLQEYNAFMDVTAITRRRHPILTSFISQVTPSELSVIRRVAMEPVFLNHLRSTLAIRGVKRVAMHEPLTSLYAVIAIQFERGDAGDGNLARAVRCVRAASLRRQMDHRGRRGYRSGKRRRVVLGDVLSLPAAARSQDRAAQGSRSWTARSARQRRERGSAHQRDCSKGIYAPVALPKREFMEQRKDDLGASWPAAAQAGSRHGTAMISAIGRRSWSVRRGWQCRAIISRLARSLQRNGASDVAMNTPVARDVATKQY